MFAAGFLIECRGDDSLIILMARRELVLSSMLASSGVVVDRTCSVRRCLWKERVDRVSDVLFVNNAEIGVYTWGSI